MNNNLLARAAASNVAFAGLHGLVQIVITAVLARLLTPADYGIYVFAQAVMVYILHVSQRGLTTTLLRKREIKDVALGDAYICAIVLGAASAFLLMTAFFIMLVASPDLEEQAWIMLFMTVPLMLQTVATPANAILQRRLAMRAINLIALGGVIFGGITATLCAMAGLGAWSLAIGNAAGASVGAVLTLWHGRSAVKLSVRRHILSELKEAVQVNAIRFLDIGWNQGPIIFFGLVSSPALTGIYQRMHYIADLSFQMTVWKVNAVLNAAFAPDGHDGVLRGTRFLLSFTVTATLTLPIMAFAWTASDAIIMVLLGDAWIAGTWPLRILVTALGANTMNQAASMALEHAGHFRRRFEAAFAGLAALIVLLLLINPESLQFAALPALLSILVAFAFAQVAAGQRTFGQWMALGRCMRPGMLIGLAVAGGAVGGKTLAAWGEMEIPLLILLLQGGLAGLAAVLLVPLVSRLDESKLILEKLASAFPRGRLSKLISALRA